MTIRDRLAQYYGKAEGFVSDIKDLTLITTGASGIIPAIFWGGAYISRRVLEYATSYEIISPKNNLGYNLSYNLGVVGLIAGVLWGSYQMNKESLKHNYEEKKYLNCASTLLAGCAGYAIGGLVIACLITHIAPSAMFSPVVAIIMQPSVAQVINLFGANMGALTLSRIASDAPPPKNDEKKPENVDKKKNQQIKI